MNLYEKYPETVCLDPQNKLYSKLTQFVLKNKLTVNEVSYLALRLISLVYKNLPDLESMIESHTIIVDSVTGLFDAIKEDRKEQENNHDSR